VDPSRQPRPQFEIEPAEVRRSVTVTVPPDSPVVRNQAKDLPKALRLPASAKPGRSDPSAGGRLPTPGKRPGVILADDHGYWRVPAKPEAVIAWIEAHRPARSMPAVSRDGPGNQPGASRAFWFASFSFPAKQPDVSLEVLVVVEAAKGGGTALRADGQVFVYCPEPTKG
jgi:hypothetical protein